jgi:hypothetical protein
MSITKPLTVAAVLLITGATVREYWICDVVIRDGDLAAGFAQFPFGRWSV